MNENKRDEALHQFLEYRKKMQDTFYQLMMEKDLFLVTSYLIVYEMIVQMEEWSPELVNVRSQLAR